MLYLFEALLDQVVIHVTIVRHWHHFHAGASFLPRKDIGVVFEDTDEDDWKFFFLFRAQQTSELRFVFIGTGMLNEELKSSDPDLTERALVRVPILTLTMLLSVKGCRV